MDHERLRVYQLACKLAEVLKGLEPQIKARRPDLADQMNRACASIALSIAEGTAQTTPRARIRCYTIGRGSAQEVGGVLDQCVSAGVLRAAQIIEPKAIVESIVRMLVKLIQSVEKGRKDRPPETER